MPAPLKTLQLTYVLYQDTPFDKVFALLTFTPFVVLIGLASQIGVRRCLESSFLFAGLLFSTALNLVLKEIIKQPRPEGSHRHDYGMPSDHSQFMAFFCTYFILWLFSSRVKWRDVWLKHLISIGSVVGAALVIYSRVRLGVHSVAQVVIGASLGVLLGWFWHSLLGQRLVRPRVYRWLCNSALGRWLRLRDAAHLPDPIHFDWHLAEWANVGQLLATLQMERNGNSDHSNQIDDGDQDNDASSSESSSWARQHLSAVLQSLPGVDEETKQHLLAILASPLSFNSSAWSSVASEGGHASSSSSSPSLDPHPDTDFADGQSSSSSSPSPTPRSTLADRYAGSLDDLCPQTRPAVAAALVYTLMSALQLEQQQQQRHHHKKRKQQNECQSAVDSDPFSRKEE